MTDPAKLYVIANSSGPRCSYLTHSKARRGMVKTYWGQYIGTAGKRYGALRVQGGATLDSILREHPEWVALEVEK